MADLRRKEVSLIIVQRTLPRRLGISLSETCYIRRDLNSRLFVDHGKIDFYFEKPRRGQV